MVLFLLTFRDITALKQPIDTEDNKGGKGAHHSNDLFESSEWSLMFFSILPLVKVYRSSQNWHDPLHEVDSSALIFQPSRIQRSNQILLMYVAAAVSSRGAASHVLICLVSRH